MSDSQPSTFNLQPRFGAAFGLALLLSVLLCWLPILGPLIAGVVAGRKAVRPGAAFVAGLLPAILWAGIILYASSHPIHAGGQEITAGPLEFLAPVTAAALVGGALMGCRSRPMRILGAIGFIVALAWFYRPAHEVYSTARTLADAFKPQPVAVQGTGCPDNLAQIYKAVQFYADDWDSKLPPADHWMTAIKDNVKDEQLHCPAVSHAGESRYGYAMNPALSGKRLNDVPKAQRATTPVFYDSTDLAPDAHAGPESMPKPGRHGGKDNVLFADGVVRQQ